MFWRGLVHTIWVVTLCQIAHVQANFPEIGHTPSMMQHHFGQRTLDSGVFSRKRLKSLESPLRVVFIERVNIWWCHLQLRNTDKLFWKPGWDLSIIIPPKKQAAANRAPLFIFGSVHVGIRHDMYPVPDTPALFENSFSLVTDQVLL